MKMILRADRRADRNEYNQVIQTGVMAAIGGDITILSLDWDDDHVQMDIEEPVQEMKMINGVPYIRAYEEDNEDE